MKLIPSIEKIRAAFKTGTHLHPLRDWFLLLVGTATLLGASAGFHVFNYFEVMKEKSITTPPAQRALFDTAAVDAAHKAFELRGTEAARFTTEYRFVDPSR